MKTQKKDREREEGDRGGEKERGMRKKAEKMGQAMQNTESEEKKGEKYF